MLHHPRQQTHHQKKPGFNSWISGTDLAMEYESLVEIGSGIIDSIRIKNTGSKMEQDLFGSLRAFQLKSEVPLTGKLNPKGKLDITFKSWYCSITDKYDIDGQEYLTLPNPGFNKTFVGAVSPGQEYIKIYHKYTNALISANLAATYNVKIN